MQQDKKLHLFAGAIIAALTYTFSWGVLSFNLWLCVVSGLAMAVLAGYVREWINYHYPTAPKKPLFDKMDWLYTSIGGLIGTLFLLTINILWE